MHPSKLTTDVTNAGSSGHPPSPTVASDSSAYAQCTICIEPVIDEGDRSVARLPCGHKFHLDCIGSAFNSRGVMRCPNCRRIEHGEWRYANGSVGANSLARNWLAEPHNVVYNREPTTQWLPYGGFNGYSSPGEMTALSNVAPFVGNYVYNPGHTIAAAQASASSNYNADSNYYHPLHVHGAPSNPFVGSTHVLPQGPQSTYYTTPRRVSRETPVTNSQSHERSQIHYQTPHATSHHEQPDVVTITPSSESLVISGGALQLPIVVNFARQLNTRGVHGVHNNEAERDESADVPSIRGTRNHPRP